MLSGDRERVDDAGGSGKGKMTTTNATHTGGTTPASVLGGHSGQTFYSQPLAETFQNIQPIFAMLGNMIGPFVGPMPRTTCSSNKKKALRSHCTFRSPVQDTDLWERLLASERQQFTFVCTECTGPYDSKCWVNSWYYLMWLKRGQ